MLCAYSWKSLYSLSGLPECLNIALVYLGVYQFPVVFLNRVSLNVWGQVQLPKTLPNTPNFINILLLPLYYAHRSSTVVQSCNFNCLFLIYIEIRTHFSDNPLVLLTPNKINPRFHIHRRM